MALIGSQYSTVTVSRYYFRINRISDRIRYPNTGIDPNSQTTRLQRRIYTRIMDYDRGVLCFQVRAAAKNNNAQNVSLGSYDFVEKRFHEFEANSLLGIIIICGFNNENGECILHLTFRLNFIII